MLSSEEAGLQVAVDVGGACHRVAIGRGSGQVLDEFDVPHTPAGMDLFFSRIESHRQQGPVQVAMEGSGGWARPLDREVLRRGWRLFNVNSLKLSRYKEIFPAAAKSDPIDARKMLELFELRSHLPTARGVLQEVISAPVVHDKLKSFSRRRDQLVAEKVRITNNMQADLRSVAPGLLEITGQVSNLWFLQFLTSRADLRQLGRLKRSSLLKIKGVGARYVGAIEAWQAEAKFSDSVEWMGPMIIDDAHRTLSLISRIKALKRQIASELPKSPMANRLASIPGFGTITCAVLAGEIGALARFKAEPSLALYLGLATLEHSSGTYKGARRPQHVNRRTRAALMVATVRHMKCVPESRAYYDKKRAEGKSHRQAVRALGRHLVRVVWSILKHNRDYEMEYQNQKTK